MDRNVKAFEVFSKVLDHVIALGLAVHQDIKVQLFLQLDDALDLILHQRGVLIGADGTLVGAGTGRADFPGLGEGPDGGGGQRRQCQRSFLRCLTHFIRRAVEVGRGQCGQAGTHLRTVDTCRHGAGGNDG